MTPKGLVLALPRARVCAEGVIGKRLVNNAGRSIRRAIEASYDRFHDFERTMQLNYFGALRITMGLLPGMVAKKKGHVVNISSISVLVSAPRFSAYVASKAALDAWTACAASEYADKDLRKHAAAQARQRRRQGRKERQAYTLARSHRDGANDARHSFLR